MRIFEYRFAAVLAVAVITACTVDAKNKQSSRAAQQDQIEVTAHIAVSQQPVTGFVFTQHQNQQYVYAERGSAAAPILLDITRPDEPKVVSMPVSTGNATPENLVAVAGTAVIASESAPQEKRTGPQTIRIIDYSDPVHPKVTRQFDGVTAIETHNGLILLANPEGIWILSEKLAADPRDEERYARKVIYGESMY
jgi:hypothetical protein